jgi:HKD family nuclease
MAKASIARRLLRQLTFTDIKSINDYYEQPGRRSKEEMISQIVYQTGTSLETLVSAGLFPLTKWNEIVVDQLGGSPRKSFESVAEEIEACLDPVYEEFSGEITINEIRDDDRSIKILAKKMRIDKDFLSSHLMTVHGSTQLSRFIREFRESQNNPIDQQPHQEQDLTLYASTRVKNVPSLEKLSISWMRKQMENADEISIAAGFYDEAFISDLMSKHKTVQKIRLMFNGYRGQRLDDQKRDLKKFRIALSANGRQIDIRLASAPGMFHTKLFLTNCGGKISALVGSANATNAALYKNEELLVALPNAQTLLEYFNSAWTTATSLDSEDMPVDSLVSFFKTGILYFKPIASLTTTFNPFRELLKLLSNEERELIGGIRLPFADQTTGIGPFNLKHAAFLEKSTDDEANSESEESEVNRTIRASIKPYSIETCYGYWVPSFFNHELKEKLDAAGAIKINKWMELQKKLNTSQESLEIKYQEYLDAARQALKIVPNLSKYLNEISVNPFDPKLFTNFFNRVHMYLDSPDRIERLSLPFVSGAIPEIWDDSQAYLDFHTSFFEYLEYVAKQSQNKPKVPGKILNAINADEEFDAEDLMSALEIHLEENGWSENDWSEK